MALTIDDFKEGTEYQMKENFTDGTVKTQADYDKAKWIDCVYTEGDRPYINRALTGRNAENGLCGVRLKPQDKPEIKVDESIPTAKGVNFVLYPIKDLHTEEDVEALKAETNRLRDVITIRTTWLHDPKAVQQWKEALCGS